VSDDKEELVVDNKPIEVGNLLQDAIDAEDKQRVVDIIESISKQDALRHLSMMNSAARETMLAMLSPETVAQMMEEAPSELAASMFKSIEAEHAVKIMDELSSDTQADLVQEMPGEHAEALLSVMDAEDAADLRKLSEYDPDTGGGLMELDVFQFQQDETVRAVIQRMVAGDDEFERHRGQHPYIVDEHGILVGVVSLRGLLRSRRATLLSSIMNPPISVRPEISHDDLIALFDKYPFLGVPVTDEQGLLLGVVSRIEVAEAELERAEQQSLSRQQVGDELRSMPLLLRSRRRLVWLSSNIVLNIIAASVIASYEETLTAVIAIAIFLPMVSDMSGCSGNQAVGVSMRELALGLTRPVDLFHVLKKELGVGIINGIVLGILIGFVAWIWKDNVYLGVVLGLALAMNTVIAVAIGGTVPLLLKRLGVDPAVASGPLLTTVTDMAGFFLVLSLATFFMPQLLA